MKMTKTLKQRICQFMAGVLLFAQMSIAAYACPGLTASIAPQANVSAMPADMVGCDQMMAHGDKALPNLCAEHCHQGQQSDQTQVPALPAMLLISLYTIDSMVTAIQSQQPGLSEHVPLAAPPPALSILNCCFRI